MTPDCVVCAGPPGGFAVMLLKDQMPVEARTREAWLAQPCAACGLALGVHQTYLHPHTARSYGQQCTAFRSVVVENSP